jgi:ribonuclease HI
VSIEEEEVDINNSLDYNGEFLCRFEDALINSTCFTIDGSKGEGNSFTGYTLLDIEQEAIEKHRASNIASIFTAEGLTIAETLKSIQNYEPGRFVVFSDSKSWIQVLGGTQKINNALYLAWNLRDKIRELDLIGRRIEFFWIPTHCSIQINEKVDSGAKSAINNGENFQFLLPSSYMKACWTGYLQRSSMHCLVTGTEKGTNSFNSTTVKALKHGLKPSE